MEHPEKDNIINIIFITLTTKIQIILAKLL